MPNTAPDKKVALTLSEQALERLLTRAENVLAQIEARLATTPNEPDWNGAVAYRWRKRGGRGYLQGISRPAPIQFVHLKNIERQKKIIEANTRQFIAGRTANNVLLTGARGTGKSSLIKACLNRFAKKGLRLIEVDKADLVDLPDIVELIANRPERFIVFCDDLSFEEGEVGYKALKVALDGSIAEPSDNVLIYATSNRRHLMPERIEENLTYGRGDDGEIHPGEGIEEKISLSERFGLWLSFYPFKQDEYLSIVEEWLSYFGCDVESISRARDEALRWALERGSRSGRVAWQFARDWAGRQVKPNVR